MPDATKTKTRPPRRFAVLLTFLRSESTGGLFLAAAAVFAFGWSNGPAADLYHHLVTLPIGISVGERALFLPIERWVNDGLMALFFLTVSLEIRREITEGQLAGWSRAAAPGIAAFGGMVVPALIFVAFNWGNSATIHGWAVPVATDIRSRWLP